MKANELQIHIFKTYLSLRYGMAIFAFAFPVLLYAIGVYNDIPLQDSMSNYYFATPCEAISKSCDAAGSVFLSNGKMGRTRISHANLVRGPALLNWGILVSI